MNRVTDIHPNDVLELLLSKSERSNKRANLTKMHEVCRKQYESGSRDFSLPVIGRQAEVEGFMKGRALYNAQSADYRVLIAAWAVFAGPAPQKSSQSSKPLASHQYLERIPDPAMRSVIQAIIAERDRLKAQLNVLKAHTQVTVDRRPLGASISVTSTTQSVAVLAPSAQLTSSERDALKKAVLPDYLEDKGLREGSHGEILNERGRTIFEVGFARAIRKILGD
jgi:hypothetical protein